MDLNNKFVITISREAGSGGRTIGRKLAEKLNVAFCDKQVIQGLTERYNLDASEIERIKSQKKNWFDGFAKWFSAAAVPTAFIDSSPGSSRIIDSEELFHLEKEIILGLANKCSCVIAGRFGFYVLKDHPNKVNILIRAPREARIERISQKQNLTREEAASVVDRVDESRSNYIRRIAGVDRYDSRNYDLVLNMAALTEDQAIQCILGYLGFEKP